MPKYKIIPRKQLKPPAQPLRTQMDEQALEDLASSIRLLGILEPLLVKQDASHYEVIDGHRRLVAAGMASVELLPCLVFEKAESTQEAIMLHANVCREDVTAAEEGWQFLELAEKHGWSVEQICRCFRRSENYIQDRVDLVQLAPEVAKAVAERKISFAVAREIRKCKVPERRAYLLDQAVVHGCSVRTVRYMIEQFTAEETIAAGGSAAHTPAYQQPSEPAAQPSCVFCDRDDDPSNMGAVPCHTYHMTDLLKLLEQLGVNRVPRG